MEKDIIVLIDEQCVMNGVGHKRNRRGFECTRELSEDGGGDIDREITVLVSQENVVVLEQN